MNLKAEVSSEIIIEHPTVKGLFVKITTTPNSVKAECFNRRMSIADYNTKTHTYGGAVYFFHGDPTDRNNELRNTTYFADMQEGLTDKTLALERRERDLKDQRHKFANEIRSLEEREERVLQREQALKKTEDSLRDWEMRLRSEQEQFRGCRTHPRDKFVFKLSDGNEIRLLRENLDHIVWIKP